MEHFHHSLRFRAKSVLARNDEVRARETVGEGTTTRTKLPVSEVCCLQRGWLTFVTQPHAPPNDTFKKQLFSCRKQEEEEEGAPPSTPRCLY